MNTRKTKFIPAPRSCFDIKTLRQMRDAVNALLNGQFVNGQVIYSDSNVMWIGASASGEIQTFQLVSDGGDYYNCQSYDGQTASGSIIKVAKNQDLRCTLPAATPAGGAWPMKTIRGITYQYIYNAVTGTTTDGVDVVEYTRSVSGSDGSFATSEVTPCLNIGDIITGYSITFKAPATLAGVLWQAMADGRAWADEPI